MRVDLDDLYICDKCGICFDYTISLKRLTDEYNSYYNNWEGNCPNCKNKIGIYE